MMLAALASLVRALPLAPAASDEDGLSAVLGDGLILALVELDTAIGRIAARPRAGVVSRSRVFNRYAVLVAPAGQVGLDMESIGRVARNATARDGWLAPFERTLVERSAEPIVELACHWVLKEAYGKALGVGLDLPLDDLTFGARSGAIALEGVAAPAYAARWCFGLYRHADLMFGTAYRPHSQVGTPLAPAGRNPPTAVADR